MATKDTLNSFCRACMEPFSDTRVYLFQSPELVELYVCLSSTTLRLRDPLSKAVCYNCNQELKSFEKFRKKCQNSYDSFMKIVTEVKVKKEEIVLSNEMKVDEEFETPQPETFDEKFGETIDNDESVSNDSLGEFKTPQPELLSLGAFETSQPELLDEKFDATNDYESISIESVGEADSDYDPQTSITKGNTKVKVKTENDQKQSDNGSKKVIRCEKCPKRFFKRFHYDAHVRKHLGLKPYACTLCSKSFNEPVGLTYHLDFDHEKKFDRLPCKIEGCDRTFKNVRSLNAHVQKLHPSPDTPGETPNRPGFVCELCGKVLTSQGILKTHIRWHEKTWPCEVCSLEFSGKKELSQHMKRMHEPIKRHVCSYCGVRFLRKQYLVVHVATHTGERLYECPVCGKKFIQTTAFRRHVERHDKMNNTNYASSVKSYEINTLG